MKENLYYVKLISGISSGVIDKMKNDGNGEAKMENKFLALESSLNTILNINLGSNIRLRELQKIEEYTKGLANLQKSNAAMVRAVLDAFIYELQNGTADEECTGGYNKILKEMLNINRSLRGQKCIVYGDNWLAEEIAKKMRARNYCVFHWRAVNSAYIDEYDLYFLCDAPSKAYGLSLIQDNEKIVKVWDYLKYKFITFPFFYKTYRNFKRQDAEKVKCVITGNGNIVNAVRSKLLHVSTVSLANNAQDIFYDFKMFCHAYESMSGIEYAVIGLAPYSLRYDMSRSKIERRHCVAYYPIAETMHNWEEGEHLISVFEAEDKKIKQFFDEEYLQSLYDIYENSNDAPREEKEGIFDSKAVSQERAAMNMQEINELYQRPFTDILLENKVILEEYARFCQMKGIKAIFFIPPYTDWYKEHMNMSYYHELVAALKVFCSKYDAMLVDMMPVRLPDCCFKDYADMNRIGAVKTASYLNAIFDN